MSQRYEDQVTVTMLPGGVRHERHPSFDFYDGEKAALIAAGCVPAERFPTAPIPHGKRGKVKRRFYFHDGEGNEIGLYDLRNGRWAVNHQIGEAEIAHRRREASRRSGWGGLVAVLDALRGRPNKAEAYPRHGRFALGGGERQRLEALLRALPDLADGELDDTERRHLQILRALSEQNWQWVFRCAAAALLDDAKHGAIVQPLRPRLELVVDNTERQ